MREQLEQKDESPFSCQRFETGVMFCLFEAKITVARQRPTGRDPTSPLLAAHQKEPKTLTSMCACVLKTPKTLTSMCACVLKTLKTLTSMCACVLKTALFTAAKVETTHTPSNR